MDAIDGLNERMQTAAGQLEALTNLSGRFSTTIGTAFASGIAKGKSFEDVLRSVGQRLQQVALQAAFKPIESLAKQGIGAALSQLAGGLPGLGGAGASVTPFADGGVLAAPAYFPLRGGFGLAGEAGPEAILPLARGPDGRLGVRAGGQEGRAVSVTVNVTSPDAESFRRSEAQVSAAIARAVARGRRAL